MGPARRGPRFSEHRPEDVAPEVAASGVAAIDAHPDIHAALTEWAGFAGGVGDSLDGLIVLGEQALATIDADLDA